MQTSDKWMGFCFCLILRSLGPWGLKLSWFLFSVSSLQLDGSPTLEEEPLRNPGWRGRHMDQGYSLFTCFSFVDWQFFWVTSLRGSSGPQLKLENIPYWVGFERKLWYTGTSPPASSLIPIKKLLEIHNVSRVWREFLLLEISLCSGFCLNLTGCSGWFCYM